MRAVRPVGCIVLVLAAALLGACARSPAPGPRPGPPPVVGDPGGTGDEESKWPVILALGDSLTAGQGVLRAETYPSRLEAALVQNGHRFRVVNAGISGDTSAGGRSRIEDLLRRHQPAVVIVELGANDGLRGLPVTAMQENLDAILTAVRGAGARPVLAGMEAPPNMGPDYTRDFRAVFPILSDRHDAPLIPFFLAGVGGRPELNQDDGIHPTGAGYAIVTDNVLRVLEPVLAETEAGA